MASKKSSCRGPRELRKAECSTENTLPRCNRDTCGSLSHTHRHVGQLRAEMRRVLATV